MAAPSPPVSRTWHNRTSPKRLSGLSLSSAGAAAWYLVGIALSVGLLSYAIARLRLLVIAFSAALALATILSPGVRWLERRKVPTLVATWVAFLVAFGTLGLLVGGSTSLVRDEFRGLDRAVTTGVEDIEEWLVKGPLSLNAEDVADFRVRLRREFVDLAGRGGVISGARLLAEGLTGAVLALALSFFLVKDGPQLQRHLVRAVPRRHRRAARAAGDAAWRTLTGYVRGMALIGLIEGAAMMLALTAVGVDLALPVGVLTFLSAFVPFIGAVVAGVVAVLAALVSGGAGDAVVISVFALLLQQFDNELLAPVVYGKLTRLHPVVVLSAVAGGAGLAGLAGAVLAVPFVATAVAATTAAMAVPPTPPPEERQRRPTGRGPDRGARRRPSPRGT